jgi:hypothetical protein
VPHPRLDLGNVDPLDVTPLSVEEVVAMRRFFCPLTRRR